MNVVSPGGDSACREVRGLLGSSTRRLGVAGFIALLVTLAAIGGQPAHADSPGPYTSWDVASTEVERGEAFAITGVCDTGAKVWFWLSHERSFIPVTENIRSYRDHHVHLFSIFLTRSDVSFDFDEPGPYEVELEVPDSAVPGNYRLYGICDGNYLDPAGLPVAVTGTDPRPSFADLQGQSQHVDAIRTLAAAEVTHGCETGLFCPTQDITRAQFASMVYRIVGDDLASASQRQRFADVESGSVHGQAIETLAAAGVVRGCGGGDFCPTDPITRAQAASMVARGTGLTTDRDTNPFNDVSFGSTHGHAIVALHQEGVIQGCAFREYCPAEHITRAQAASLLARGYYVQILDPVPTQRWWTFR